MTTETAIILPEISADNAPAIFGQNGLGDFVAKAREIVLSVCRGQIPHTKISF